MSVPPAPAPPAERAPGVAGPDSDPLPGGQAREAVRSVLPLSVDLGFAAVLGALQTVAFVRTATWPLQLVCIALLVWRVASRTGGRVVPRGGQRQVLQAGAMGLVYGSAWLGAGTWWMYVSLHDYGGLPAWLAALSVALLSAALSLYLASATAGFAMLRRGKALPDAVLFGMLWLLAELARGVIFTGFPWIATGYAQVDSPLAGFAPWVGVYGIGAIAAALGAGLGVTRWRRERSALSALLAMATVLGAGMLAGRIDFSKPNGRLTVTLLQGNVPQEEKFASEHLPEALAWTREHLLSARGDRVVAPETVIPLLPDQLDPAWWTPILEHFQQGRQAAIVGLPLGDPASGYTNSAAGIGPGTADLPGGFYRYDKHHLVPFGEFIPTGFRWFTEMMNIPLGDFNRGPLAAPSFVVQRERVAPNICYEDLFGEELATRFTDPAKAPTIFANLSNIAWFGKTLAVEQHLQISRMRTLEFQRPMLRATNTGATAIIDHRGRITASIEPYTQGVVDGVVEGRTGLTLFARWAGRFGLWPAWLLGAAVLLLLGRRAARP